MSREIVHCANCDAEASPKHGLPMNNNCDIVAITDKGPWHGAPACETCHDLHAAAGEHGAKVLDVYARSTDEQRTQLAECRTILLKIADLAEARP